MFKKLVDAVRSVISFGAVIAMGAGAYFTTVSALIFEVASGCYTKHPTSYQMIKNLVFHPIKTVKELVKGKGDSHDENQQG